MQLTPQTVPNVAPVIPTFFVAHIVQSGDHNLTLSDTSVEIQSIYPPDLIRWLGVHPPDQVLALLVEINPSEDVPAWLLRFRDLHPYDRTRIYLVSQDGKAPGWALDINLDIERVLTPAHVQGIELATLLSHTKRSFGCLTGYVGMPRAYLAGHELDLITWFEASRWQWESLGSFDGIDKSLVQEDDLALVRSSIVAEFGTLPGAHNFLREWGDEYTFSTWALSWGAEEARHSLILAQYLKVFGDDVPSRSALYKREPYPMGFHRAGTLMMNIISETRASHYYRTLSTVVREPLLEKIWKLLSRDEARHARAFFVFCQRMCKDNPAAMAAALEMAWVWLADRRAGMKHPSGEFYPHTETQADFRHAERFLDQHKEGITDAADAAVFAMIRNLTGDDWITTPRDLKRKLRDLI